MRRDHQITDESNTLEHVVGQLTALKSIEERIAELGQWLEVLLGIDDQRVARYHVLLLVVHDGDERVGGWLRAYSNARKVRLEQILYKRCFTYLRKKMKCNKFNNRNRIFGKTKHV